MANKKQKQEALEVAEALNKSEAFFNKNKNAIIIAVVVLLALIAGILVRLVNSLEASRDIAI